MSYLYHRQISLQWKPPSWKQWNLVQSTSKNVVCFSRGRESYRRQDGSIGQSESYCTNLNLNLWNTDHIKHSVSINYAPFLFFFFFFPVSCDWQQPKARGYSFLQRLHIFLSQGTMSWVHDCESLWGMLQRFTVYYFSSAMASLRWMLGHLYFQGGGSAVAQTAAWLRDTESALVMTHSLQVCLKTLK